MIFQSYGDIASSFVGILPNLRQITLRSCYSYYQLYCRDTRQPIHCPGPKHLIHCPGPDGRRQAERQGRVPIHLKAFGHLKNTSTLKCLSIGTPKTINFPFVSNEKLMFFRCPSIQAHCNEAVIYLNFGTPKNNEFSIWNKWKIYYF